MGSGIPPTADCPDGHYPTMNLLSGLAVKRTTTDVEVGTTMDQLLAGTVGSAMPLPSLVLGTEPPGYGTNSGYTQLDSAYVSWSSPTTPAPKEIVPRQAFDLLFDDGSRRRGDASVLDLVATEASGLRGRLSRRDRAKLDECLMSVRELEQRIERADDASRQLHDPLLLEPDGWQLARLPRTADRLGGRRRDDPRRTGARPSPAGRPPPLSPASCGHAADGDARGPFRRRRRRPRSHVKRCGDRPDAIPPGPEHRRLGRIILVVADRAAVGHLLGSEVGAEWAERVVQPMIGTMARLA